MPWLVAFVIGLLGTPSPRARDDRAMYAWHMGTLQSYADGDYERFDRELRANTNGTPARLAYLARGFKSAGRNGSGKARPRRAIDGGWSLPRWRLSWQTRPASPTGPKREV